MKKFIKYGVVPVGIFSILLFVTVILIPILINVQKYVPEIEKQVRAATGRSFSLGPELGVSFFPWLSISFSDMKIGNPPGFTSDEFVKVRTFEARIKVLPLLKKQIEISRFVVGGLSVNLEKNEVGHVNWQFGGEVGSGDKTASSIPFSLEFLAKRLSFALLAVTDGQVKWHDRTQDIQYKAEDIMLLLNDFVPGRPVSLDCKAVFNGGPVTVEGKIGPLLLKNLQTDVPMDLSFSVLNRLRGQIQGKITQHDKGSNFELSLRLLPFSLIDFFPDGHLFPLLTKDAETFRVRDLAFTARGGTQQVTVEKGIAHFDDSTLNFSFQAQDFESSKVDFALDLDTLDLDRYFLLSEPYPKSNDNEAEKGGQENAGPRASKNLALSGVIQVGQVKLHGGTMTNLRLPLQGGDGIFTVSPVTLETSRGQVEAALTFDRRGQEPVVRTTVKAQGLDAALLLHDYFGYDSLRGDLSAEMALQFAGDTLLSAKQNLNGEATLMVQGGALAGLDTIRMPDASESLFSTVSVASGEKQWTDFAEMKSVATITNGLVHISEINCSAPTYSLQVKGTADLVRQQLDLQLEAGLVTTTVGKRGREEKVNKSVLYAINGTFQAPELTNQTTSSSDRNAGGKVNAKHLLEQKPLPPFDDDVKNLVGKDLVDPDEVAKRFKLQPETLRCNDVKKKLPIGTGKVSIGVLREEQ